MYTTLLAVGMVLSGLGASPLAGQLLFLSEDRLPVEEQFRSVYRVDLSELDAEAQTKARIIYTSELSVRDMVRAKVADRIIVHATDHNTGYTEVAIINQSGKVLKTFENAVSAVFIDPLGTKMVFTKGYMDSNLLQASRGTWLYDFGAGREEKIADTGLYLERTYFDNSVYVRRGDGSSAFRYDIAPGRIEEVDLYYGGFSPQGTYRWGYKLVGGVEIVQRKSGNIVSEDFELFSTRHHGTPLYWMNDNLIMVPHAGKELEDYLLFVETGRTLKAPGRALAVTEDGTGVYVCKPGLVVEKVPMDELQVLYESTVAVAVIDED